jgi:hypothetical protein
VYLQTRGRTVIPGQLVARFTKRNGSFAWNGKANVRGRSVADGYYVAKLQVPVGRSSDVRQVALVRKGGRFRRLPAFVKNPVCAALSGFGAIQPVFGGSNNRALVVYYRLHRQSRVTITLNRGKRVVKRFRATTRGQGAYRLRIPARGVRAGRYDIVLTAVPSGGKKVRAKVTVQRL